MASPHTLLLVRPAAFGFNAETAPSNAFQQRTAQRNLQQAAVKEFDAFVQMLAAHDIPTLIFDDTVSPAKPDAVFPNNWFSTHDNGTLVLYPMCAPNRRTERRADIVDLLKKQFGYRTVHDLTHFENEGKFLEGTGSIVFDHEQRIAYAALSPRTDKDVLLEVCGLLGYLPLVFSTAGRNGQPVYHTNVVMALAETLAVVCFECILPEDLLAVQRMLELSGKTLLPVTLSQMESFAGNMLFVRNALGKPHVLVSRTAWNSIRADQQELLQNTATPVFGDIPTIETAGGGSVRCMVAELIC